MSTYYASIGDIQKGNIRFAGQLEAENKGNTGYVGCESFYPALMDAIHAADYNCRKHWQENDADHEVRITHIFALPICIIYWKK